jgi:hypothetical protein
MWHKSSLKNYFSETHRLQLNWIRQLVISSFVVCAIIAVALYLIYVTHPKEFALPLLVCGINGFYILGKLYRPGAAFRILSH